MKKSIILVVLGLTTNVVCSYGTGYVFFSSYNANQGAGAVTTLNQSLYYGGTRIGIPYQADLYYSLGTVSDPVNFGSNSSIISLPTGLTDLGVFSAYANSGITAPNHILGYFDEAATVIIPGYVSGPITFEVVAFNGSTYADSTIRGRSGSFTMNDIANSLILVPPFLGDNGAPMPDFIVQGIPEPATLALVALSGLVALTMVRSHCNRSVQSQI